MTYNLLARDDYYGKIVTLDTYDTPEEAYAALNDLRDTPQDGYSNPQVVTDEEVKKRTVKALDGVSKVLETYERQKADEENITTEIVEVMHNGSWMNGLLIVDARVEGNRVFVEGVTVYNVSPENIRPLS